VERHTAPVQEIGQAPATRGGGLLQDADLPPPEEMCSICHDEFTMPCQANCSHWFCGESLSSRSRLYRITKKLS
jgi:hypothetical protein